MARPTVALAVVDDGDGGSGGGDDGGGARPMVALAVVVRDDRSQAGADDRSTMANRLPFRAAAPSTQSCGSLHTWACTKRAK